MKKRVISLVLALCFCIAFLPVPFVNAEEYIGIYTAEDLAAINNNLSRNYILMNDIDLSEYENWSPLASLDNPFTGVLNGNGYKISNMNISAEVKGVINIGLFVKISGGRVHDLSIENAVISMVSNEKTFQGDPSCAGLLAAQADNVKITNCNTSGKISIMGKGNTVQSGCVSICAGGLIGKSSSSEFYGCDNMTNITAHTFDWGSESHAGGISGCTDRNSLFEKCSNSGIVVATGDITDSFGGGIVGWADCTDIKKCVNTGNIRGGASNSFPPRSASAGGISGFLSNGQIEMSYNTGLIESTYLPATVYNGGIVGSGSEICIKECYNKSTVDSYTSDYEGDTVFAGGIIGASNGIEIENVYVIGNISFSNKYNNGGRLGGIIGKADGETKITNAYIISEFEKENSGIAGTVIGISSGANLTNIYISSTQSAIVGSGSYSASNVLKASTDKLKIKETFYGFDFTTVWKIVAGEYPTLRFGVFSTNVDNDATINGKGYAYLRYKLTDAAGNILSNTPVEYTIEEYGIQGIARTDENGVVCIQTPELSESQELTITFASPYGIEIADNVKTESVTVEPLSFKQSWKGQVGLEGEIGASAGVGGDVGIFAGEASMASASLTGGLSRALALENSYDAGERTVKVSSTVGSEVATKISFGLWADGSIADIAKVKVSPLELSSNQSVVSDYTKSMVIENYDPTNLEHISKIAMFLVDNESNNIIAQIVFKMLNEESHNEEKITQIIKMSGGADVGTVKLCTGKDVEIGEVTVFSIGPSSIQTLSSTENTDDGSYTFSNGLATSIGYDLFKFNALEIVKKEVDTDTDVSGSISTERGLGFWGNFVNNNIEFESKVNSGEFNEFTVKAIEEEESSGLLFVEKVSSIEKSVIYTGSQAEKVAESDEQLTNLALGGAGVMNPSELAEFLIKIADANADGRYERDKKYNQTFDISLGFGIEALVKFGLGFNLKGIYSDQFTYQNGSVSNNTEQIQSVSTADDEFEAAKMTLGEIVAEPFQYIADVISENADIVEGRAADGVKNAAASISGTANYIANIAYLQAPQTQSYAVLAVAEEEGVFDTSSVAVTVGEPYVISIKDTEGNAVEDFSDNPLRLTLEYNADDLAAAEINNTAEDLSKLKIYWYNEEEDVFVCIGGELDYENSSVTADITKSGQYILALDNCAPSVTDFRVTNETATPTFKATVADMSGIQNFSFKIDGKEFVNDSNLAEFYSTSSALFEYQVTEPLESGEHTATITASDSAGNTMVNSMSITFNVDNAPPVINSLEISDKITDGKISASAFIAEDDLNCVKLYIKKGDSIATYNLTQESEDISTTVYNSKQSQSPYLVLTSLWSTEINIETGDDITAWVIAYDNAGNSSESEKKVIEGEGLELEIFGENKDKFTATYRKTSESIIIKAVGDVPDIQLVVAEYEGDKLSKAQVSKGSETEDGKIFTVEIPQSEDYKIMLWDKNLYPLIDVITE